MSRTSVVSKILQNLIKNKNTLCHRYITTQITEEPKNEDDATTDMPTLTTNPYRQELQKCILCKLNIEPDYKNVRMLSQFQSRYTGKIYGRHITGLCKNKQEKVEKEILKAQNAGLMAYMTKEPKYVNDPKLFDPNHPFKPHNYE